MIEGWTDIEGFGGHMDALGGLGLIPIKGD